jgi:hypothetical protein
MTYLELEVSERWGLESDAAYEELSQRYRALAAQRGRYVQIAGTVSSVVFWLLALVVIVSVVMHFLAGSAVWYLAVPMIVFLLLLVGLAYTSAGKSYYEKRCALWRANEIDTWLANKSSGAPGVDNPVGGFPIKPGV